MLPIGRAALEDITRLVPTLLQSIYCDQHLLTTYVSSSMPQMMISVLEP